LSPQQLAVDSNNGSNAGEINRTPVIRLTRKRRMDQPDAAKSRYKLFISYSADPDFALARRLEIFLETFHCLRARRVDTRTRGKFLVAAGSEPGVVTWFAR
jgi:hypothetical protein